MNLVVLNGSPKGDMSVTMQYVQYMRCHFPECRIVQHNVAQTIWLLQRRSAAFQRVLEDVKAADGVVWAFPLYILLIHGSYKRFIELLFERNAEHVFAGKYAVTLSSSIHFFDHTAHQYMRRISEDLGMRFAGSHSAAMRDLFNSRSREQYRLFLADALETMRRGTSEAPRPAVAPSPAPRYQHQPPAPSIYTTKKVTVIADHLREGSNLAAMIERFRGSFASRPELLTLEDARIKGGCLGCLQCGYANRCAYEDKDGFVGFFNEKVLGSDILVFTGQVRDRFLSSLWKTFMDRSFFRTHQPSMRGRHIAFLVSGHLTPNTREVLNAWIQMHEADLTDIVTDEQADSSAVDAAITSVAERLVRRSENGTIRNRDFLGVGGTKVFRDEIWGSLRLVFRADHRFYRQHGTYDFPQRQLLQRIAVGLAAALINLPPFRRRFYADLRRHMVRRYQKHLGGGGNNGAAGRML